MTEKFWPNGPIYKQTDAAFPLSTDSVLLAHFAARIKAKRVIDLGCGAGALCVLLHTSHPDAALRGIEIDPDAAMLCRENLAANGVAADGVVTGDLRDCWALWKAGGFDLAVSNPPYFARGHGAASPDIARGAARDERDCTLDELCAAAAYLLRHGGAFALVYRPERLSELFCTLTAHGLEPKRARFVQYKATHAPSLVLLEARRGGKPGLNIEKPLLLCNDSGGESEEYKLIYHRG